MEFRARLAEIAPDRAGCRLDAMGYRQVWMVRAGLDRDGDWTVRARSRWGERETTRTIGRGPTALRALRKAGLR